MCEFREVLLITVQTWLWFHYVTIAIRPRQSLPILFFVKSIRLKLVLMFILLN